MSNVQRMWAGSLHTVEPDRLLNGIYCREQVVFAKDYDALREENEWMRHAIEKAVRVWGDTMTGDGADGETMYLLRRAIARGAHQTEARRCEHGRPLDPVREHCEHCEQCDADAERRSDNLP